MKSGGGGVHVGEKCDWLVSYEEVLTGDWTFATSQKMLLKTNELLKHCTYTRATNCENLISNQ